VSHEGPATSLYQTEKECTQRRSTSDVTSQPDVVYANVIPAASPWQPADAEADGEISSRTSDGHVSYANLMSPDTASEEQSTHLYANVNKN